MRLVCLFVLGFCLLTIPYAVRAKIIINEVAWMGTDEGGANCEWVELRNTENTVVPLSSWTLTIENSGTGVPKVISLGEAASVKYSGIAENGYYLIARDSGSCKDLMPHTSADWLGSFGNGISNSGAKLILKEGTEERDVVDSKTGWETSKNGVGGKNSTPKETPQYTGSSWITAAPTPRGPNRNAPLEELPEEEAEDAPPVVTVGGTAPLVPVTHPVQKLYVDGGPSRIVTAGADTFFTAIAYDSIGQLRKNADITFTFGDGGQEKGREVRYAYKKPGTYTAVIRAKDKGISAVSLIEVVVREPHISITQVNEEGITLTNTSESLADLSGWKIHTASKSVKLPDDTVLAPGASTLFAYETLGIDSSDNASLAFPNGRVAYAYTKPDGVGDELQKVQASAPLHSLAITPRPYASQAVSAPAVKKDLATAGAALPEIEQTVVLSQEQGFFSSLLSSVVSSVTGIFSR